MQLARAGRDIRAFEWPHGHARRTQHHELEPLLIGAVDVFDAELENKLELTIRFVPRQLMRLSQ